MQDDAFQEGTVSVGERVAAEALIVDVGAFEGPLDLLLTLSRTQKVDLRQISILELAHQYLAFVEQAKRLRLELAADYLVMAAWLAFLKSRLLLPPDPSEEGPSGEELAAHLAFQLERLQAMRESAAKLMARDQLGRDLWARILFGGRISVSVAVLVVFLAIGIGVPLGIIAGYFGGWVDQIIMRTTDVFLAFPPLLLAIFLSAILGPGFGNLILAI